MLRRIWQWLKGLFQRLFGTPPQPSPYQRQGEISASPLNKGEQRGIEPPPALADSDYEYLFRQLLEGVAHGWPRERILRWFEGLKGRATEAEWAAWLRRFGERVLASPAPNDELAMRLVLLGEQILSVPSIQEIGEVAYGIGTQLLDRNPGEPIWEYEGPDASSLTPPNQGEEPINPEAGETVTITLDELLVRLEQDPNLVQLLAQQVGIETTDPQVIVEALINQFNAANQSAIDEAEAWFNQGNQQDESGDFEGAIASYDQALEMRPDLHEAWFNRANALSNLGRFEEAIVSYDKAIEFKPDFHEAWNNRGTALSNLGQLEEASASYEKAKEIQTS